jgi:hypothetical protein
MTAAHCPDADAIHLCAPAEQNQPGFAQPPIAEQHLDLSIRAVDLSGGWLNFYLSNCHVRS